MKKIAYYTLSVVFLSAAVSSCAKSSKGKMANEWKVTSFQQTETDTDSDGDKTVTTTTMTENSATMTTESTPNGGTTTTTSQTATVNMYEMNIEKDGTWTSTRDVTFNGTGFSQKSTLTANGTWSFVGKTKGDDFKKNERVMFNTLSETDQTVTTIGSSSTTNSSTNTYMTGENVMVYTIKESKKKELKLESEMGNTYTSGNSTSSVKGTTTITLEEK